MTPEEIRAELGAPTLQDIEVEDFANVACSSSSAALDFIMAERRRAAWRYGGVARYRGRRRGLTRNERIALEGAQREA